MARESRREREECEEEDGRRYGPGKTWMARVPGIEEQSAEKRKAKKDFESRSNPVKHA